MLRKGSLLFLALAIVLAAAAAFAAHRWIQRQGALAAASRIAMTPVVVAARDLPAGRSLSSGDLSVTRWPRAGLPPGSFHSMKALQGRVLKTAASRGEPILAGKLAPKGLPGGLSAVVPKGFRAMTVKVNEVIGVAGFVQPGDQVDVLVTIAKGPYQKNPVTRTVLQGVKVLTVGERVEASKGSKKPKRHKSRVVTLQLTPRQGETLALASHEGKLLLSLRNRADHTEQVSPGVRLSALLPVTSGKQGKSQVVKVENKPPMVEVIKGVVRVRQDLGVSSAPAPAGTTTLAQATRDTGEVPCYLKRANSH